MCFVSVCVYMWFVVVVVTVGTRDTCCGWLLSSRGLTDVSLSRCYGIEVVVVVVVVVAVDGATATTPSPIIYQAVSLSYPIEFDLFVSLSLSLIQG